jgi:FkbH-like protein
MFATEWAGSPGGLDVPQADIPDYPSRIATAAPLVWAEHCTECAAPQCYGECRLYEPRRDGECRLFPDGIRAVGNVPGLLGYGAAVTFRKWAKLEAICDVGQWPLAAIRRMDAFQRLMARSLVRVASLLPSFLPRWALTGRFYGWRVGMAARIGRRSPALPQVLVLGIYNPHQALKVILEVKTLERIKFRAAVPVERGFSEQFIAFADLRIDSPEQHFIHVRPEGDEEATLVFTALDLVTMKEGCRYELLNTKPLPKVKCVVWDLDNTLWSGVLVESGADELRLNEEAVRIVKLLDERGILNCVCSKNNHEQAWEKLRSFGIGDYFLAPAINWDPKSVNLRRIAAELNIGLDTFAFVDDSPFERQEVATALPEVRCFDVSEAAGLPVRPDFDVPVTEESKNRRQSYRSIQRRKEAEAKFAGNIDDFLRACELKLTIGRPADEEIARCCELLQRTNQLNISGRRLSLEQVRSLAADPAAECYALICEDQFGKYGLVGFAAVDLAGAAPVVSDLAISCRVAMRKVEHALFAWLAGRYRAKGHGRLAADFVPTERNAPLLKVLQELNFAKDDATGRWYLEIGGGVPAVDVVAVTERGG